MPGQNSIGNWDAYVRKYDTSGTEIWTHQFGSDAADFAYAVAANGDGVYIVGHTEGALPNQLYSPPEDAYIRVYDHSGVELWTHQFGSSGREYAYTVSADNTGIYMGGNTDVAPPGVADDSTGKLYLRKYNKRGIPIWTVHFGSLWNDDQVQGLALDDDAIYIAGTTESAPNQDPLTQGPADAFLARFTKDVAYDDIVFLPIISTQ